MIESKQHILLKKAITHPNICVGDHTYYHDFVDPMNFEKFNAGYFPESHNIKLHIGKFCSIAHGARFLSSAANHPMTGFSTYPFAFVFGSEECGYEYFYENKGDTHIGNDVWLGSECTILPGITIGDGAIIGTRAVVTKDVPPYTIVAGNPAKIIRKRFDPEVIELLVKIKWWDWPLEKVIKNAKTLVGRDVEALQRLT